MLEEIRNHKQYKQLISYLSQESLKDKYLPNINVFGITSSLSSSLLHQLSQDLNRSIISIYRDGISIRKYLDSALLISFKELNAGELLKQLMEYGYQGTSKVEKIGEYSVKGDLLHFWPLGLQHPVRVSFFGDDIESATLYDEIYGRSYSDISYFLLGDLAKMDLVSDLEQIRIITPSLKPLNAILFLGGDSLEEDSSRKSISFDFEYPALYYNRLDILEKDIEQKIKANYTIRVITKNLDSLPPSLQKFNYKTDYLGSGFQSEELKLYVLTDKELFGTIFLTSETKSLSSKKARQLLAQLEGEIEIGDFIVHEEHGIGIYGGVKQEQFIQEVRVGVGERIKKIIRDDYLLVRYAKGDELYIPITQIDKLTKYIAIDDQEPEITRLGKSDWVNIKKRAKESIFLIAKDLVGLYAKRELSQVEPIDTNLSEGYINFSNNFPYEVTPDQKRTETEILNDLSKTKPMNRIIVGDVGFGKTEVAMRATYKVIESGKQVAVLCPTTVLSTQHEKVFKDRFELFGIKVGALSRLNSENTKEVIHGLESGKINIVIGTHKLLSKNIKFKNLGLIVIDEEQKFGVKQKEKLKQLEVTAHTLLMSATPIPRSLSMALSNIQDISIIQTPPSGRKAVKNIVTKYDSSKVREAILHELNRGGQAYYIHNMVKTLPSCVAKLRDLIPTAKIIYAHGQMSPNTLKSNISDFYERKFDILVCTTIIENGIDMPNVNTIIIEHSQNFGLGQMYQLRGRVGRGDKQAYAYFFYDGDDIDSKEVIPLEVSESELKKMQERRKYKKRLQAIKDSHELGAGFKLASRDLEIRGAGNLLGKQQHGNIKQVGYALYMQMLSEEIEKLKNDSSYN